MKENKFNAGEIVFKVSVETDELNIDLDRVIKKLKKIKRLFAIIDLKMKAKSLLAYLKLNG